MSDGEDERQRRFRPRIGGRHGEVPMERVPRFRNAMLSRILRLASDSPGPRGRSRGVSSARDIKPPSAADRRCVVKARFVPMNARGRRAAALHLSYIERDGVEQDGSPGRLYGPDGEGDVRAQLAAELASEKRQFRFIVSPEDAGATGLTAFTRHLIAQMEHDLGRQLVWGAVNHWNTDNPHVHIVVRGLDAQGDDLTIDGRYIASGIRARASTILTNQLGPRTALDVQDQLSREVRQDRFTSLDKVLQGLLAPDGSLLETWLAGKGRIADARLLARLATLERLALVRRISAIEWTFEPDWVQTLRRLGQANDVIKRLHASLPERPPGRYAVVDSTAPLAPVEGVLRRKGLHDELAGTAFAVVEAFDGRALYVRLDLAAGERLKEHDVVRIAVEPDQSRPALDADIAGKAASRGGVIDTSNMLSHHARRLVQLEAAGLITRIGDSSWRVPGDLVERVAARARSAPTPLRVRADRLGPPLALQTKYRGPTWLDRIEPPAPPHAGRSHAELVDAILQRATHLRSLGVTATGLARHDALMAMEAQALGSKHAAVHRLELVPLAPGFQGVVSLSPRQVSGVQYVLITNTETRQLTLLPATKRLRLLDGQNVRIWRGKSGRFGVSPATGSRSIPDPEQNPGRSR